MVHIRPKMGGFVPFYNTYKPVMPNIDLNHF